VWLVALIVVAAGVGGVVVTTVDTTGDAAQQDAVSLATTTGEAADGSTKSTPSSSANSDAVGEATQPSSTTGVTAAPAATTATTVTGGAVTTTATPVIDPPTSAATTPPASTNVPVTVPPGTGGPVPVGVIADIGSGWRLQILNVNRDATAAVAAANQFNRPPPPGSTLTLITVALGYFGMDDPKSAFQTLISAVGATNVELAAECGVLPQGLNTFGEFFSGGVTVGNVCFVTTPQDASSLRVFAAGDFASGDEVFFDASAPPANVVPMAPLSGPQPGAASTPARLAPTPIGVPGDIGEGWKLTVGGLGDITDAVLAENQFNEPPPAGFRFVGVNVTYEYDGAGTSTAFSVIANAVGGANLALSTDCGVTPQRIDLTQELSAGGTVSGILCFVAPVAYPGLTLYATADFAASNVMFATS
jgi:hypothetical protein